MRGETFNLADFFILEQMIRDMSSASSLYRPSEFWKICSERLIKELTAEGIEKFRSLPASLGFFVPTYSYPRYLSDKKRYAPVKDAIDKIVAPNKLFTIRLDDLLEGKIHALSDYRTFMASISKEPPYTDRVSESDIGSPVEQFEFDGRMFSRSFLNYLLGLNFLKKNISGQKINTILEIGGGFGTLGEILLGDERNDCFYIDIDIPPLAYVAYWYLKSVFGYEAIGGYDALRVKEPLKISDLRKKYRALTLCSWQLPQLRGKIDLFVNFISFQEMEPDIVENYCSHVIALSPEFILLRNLKEGKRKKDKKHSIGVVNPILGEDYDKYLPGYRLIDSDTKVFGFRTEDGFHSELRLYKRY